MSILLRARVRLELDGRIYVSGDQIELPDSQETRARELLVYGYAAEAPAQPVKPRRRKAAS